jgi:hypothetical protein
MNLEEQIKLLMLGVYQGREHLISLYGDFDKVIETLDLESKEFLFGHLTGMMEILRQLMEDEEE